MRSLRIIVPILAVISLLAFLFFKYEEYSHSSAPVIRCSQEKVIEVPCGVTDEELLSFVSAVDDRDGDLTKKITVERKNYFLENGVTTVTYAVCDSDGNVSQISRNVVYTDYHAPWINFLGDLIIPMDETPDFSRFFQVEDAISGDISSRLKIISNDFNSLVPGAYSINLKASNVHGDSRDLAVKAYVIAQPFAVSIRLTTYSQYIKCGGTVDFTSLIGEVINYSGTRYTAADVTVDASQFKADTPGVYDVFYEIHGSNMLISRTRLVVIVEEAQ